MKGRREERKKERGREREREKAELHKIKSPKHPNGQSGCWAQERTDEQTDRQLQH